MATITGTIRYDGRPVSEFTDKTTTFWVRDDNTLQPVDMTFTYDPSTGTYSIPNMIPGKYSIEVFLDAAEGFAGDFEGWNPGIIIPANQSVTTVDLSVQKIIHLTNPVDNAASIGSMADPEDLYVSDQINFRWDPITEATSYNARIDEWESYPNRFVKMVLNLTTSLNELKLVLPVSGSNRTYSFVLNAYNSEHSLVGKLMVHYDNGASWDYHFGTVNIVTSTVTKIGTLTKTEYIGGTQTKTTTDTMTIIPINISTITVTKTSTLTGLITTITTTTTNSVEQKTAGTPNYELLLVFIVAVPLIAYFLFKKGKKV